ncbi:MAG TPA: two-component system response regulator KdpE [Moraxellaceae bacterium]
MNRTTIVVIEDDLPIRRFLKSTLEAEDFAVFETGLGREGLQLAATRKPELLILDLGLPDIDGIEVIRDLRGWSRIPVLVLSAREAETEKVAALDAGADDYLVKPFGTAELLARVRVALRHARRQDDGSPLFRFGDVQMDLAARLVRRGDSEIHLTPIEYRLLATLAGHAGKVLTHRQLLREVWGPQAVEHSHYLRIYMAQLRQKLEADPARPVHLLTETGVGYRLQA